MKAHRVCLAVAAAPTLGSRVASSQAATAVGERFDRIVGMAMAGGGAVMAVAAYRLADAPEAPGRRIPAAEATQLLQKLGLEPLRRAVYEPGGPTTR
jgi:hypothetical protein